MQTFFHGWRRKAGVAALMMACLLCGLWIRSRIVDDKVILTISGWKHLIHSERGVISWFAWDESERYGFDLPADVAEEMGVPAHLSGSVAWRRPEWQSQPVSHPAQAVPMVKPEKIKFGCGDPLKDFPPNEFLNNEYLKLATVGFLKNAVSYWMLVLPLTLLSAYLIIWKPKIRA